jgi:diacylglycerol kinase family enzyme
MPESRESEAKAVGGIGIIHNPFARGNIKRPHIADKLRRILGDHGHIFETKNLDELPDVVEQFLKQGFEILAVNGGDGSLHLALSAFIKVYKDRPLPRLLSLRGGTMNTMPNSLKLKGKTLELCKKVVQLYRAKQPLEALKQPLIRLNEQYGFMSGGGLAANFLDAYYSGTGTGPVAGAKVLGRAIASAIARGPYAQRLFAHAKAQITVDGKPIPFQEFTMFLGSTIREIGIGFKPTPRAYDKEGHFQFLATKIKPISVIPQLHKIYLGRDVIHPEYFSQVAREVLIKPLGSLRYMMDGEIYETEGPIRMSTGPTVEVIKI